MEKPKNLIITLGKGTRSFVEINYQAEKLHLYNHVFAECGQQLPEEIFTAFYNMAIGFANLHTCWKVQYVRYDLDPNYTRSERKKLTREEKHRRRIERRR